MASAVTASLQPDALTAAQRLLTCLDLLQKRGVLTGEQLAAGIDVDARTVRRYVAQLRELGIPVQGDRGAGGGYRLRHNEASGTVTLDDGEAADVLLGLRAARHRGLTSATPALEAKLQRGIPRAGRVRLQALESAVHFTAGSRVSLAPASRLVLDLAEAAFSRRRIIVASGQRSAPYELSPHAIVVHGERWFVVGHDHDEDAICALGLEQMGPVQMVGDAIDPPPGFDPAAEVATRLMAGGRQLTMDVTLALPADAARARLALSDADMERLDSDHTRIRVGICDLPSAVSMLVELDCDFDVHSPVELRRRLARLARRAISA